MGTTVFVYGTLLKGQGNHALLEHVGALYLGTAELSGYTMWSLGVFPVISKDPEASRVKPVRGELYEVDKGGLAALDRLEGVARGFYDRVMEEVICADGGRQGVYVYTMPAARVLRRLAGDRMVMTGSWAKHLEEEAQIAEFDSAVEESDDDEGPDHCPGCDGDHL